MAFTTDVSIINRGLQRLGAGRITSRAGVSKAASEANACYDGLRLWELQRNLWRFSIRRVILRAVGTALPDWDSTVTYIINSLVVYNGVNYISIHATPNLNQNPETAVTYWAEFTGNPTQKITPSAWAIGTTYAAYAIVTGTDGLLYYSVQAANLAHDPTTDTAGTYWQQYFGNIVASAYDDGTTYSLGEMVFNTSNAVYFSTTNANDNAPSTGIGWVLIACTVAPIIIPWAAGLDPSNQASPRNIFVLPYGFLREAPQDPRAGDTSPLGFPSNLPRTDWLLEGGYLISSDVGPIMLRYGADISQVSLMHAMFCEMLGNRIAYELCETLTNSNAKQTAIGQEYTAFRSQASTVNGIETGSVQPPMDDWINCRQ